MLARLDELLAPVRAAVNREGNLLRVDDFDPKETEAVVEAAASLVAEMGYFAEPISTPPGEVTRWYGVGEVDELSAEEARVLTERWTEELLRDGLVQEAERQAAGDSIQSILSTIFREAAKTGVVRTDLSTLPREAPGGLRKEVFDLVREWLVRKLASLG